MRVCVLTRCIASHNIVAASVDSKYAMTITSEHVNQPACAAESEQT